MPAKFGNLLTGMGNKTSKRKGGNQAMVSDKRESSGSGDDEFFDGIHREWGEDSELRIMRKTIECSPELFILNNLIMSGQLFENFEEEISKIRETSVSVRESEMNSLLPAQKHTLIPDVLQEQVAKNVDFIYTRPSQILSVEPLQPIRIYIVFNNIDVTEQSYASPYCTVNETVTYSMQLKQSKHKGYALLQRLEVNPSRKKLNPLRDEAIDSDDDSMYDNNKSTNIAISNNKSSVIGITAFKSESSVSTASSDSAYIPRENLYDDRNYRNPRGTNIQRTMAENRSKSLQSPASDSPAGSTSSGYRSGNYTIDSDSDNGYGGTPYPSSNTCTKNGTANSEIPRQCFTYTIEDKIYGMRKERRHKLNHKDRVIRGVMHSRIYEVFYLNSRKFMDYFYQLLTNQLAEVMGFDAEIQDEPHGAIIYRDKLELFESNSNNSNLTTCLKDEQFAMTPCIWSTWPEMANEWLERPRGTWPDEQVIVKIKESGCYLIPEGYSTEKSTNDWQNLEWEVTFPAAERYLETSMSHSQVRVYVMALMLQKTFFRPIESIIGLAGSHIRNQLFWLMEEDDRPSKWLESRSGESLLKLLDSLYRAISQDSPYLPDYFIRERNLFRGKIYLLRTQKQLKRIIENPVMYILHAMQNIRHSKSFFPVLDSSRLLRILTDDILTLINPHIAGNGVSNSIPKSNSVQPEYGQTYGFWDSAKQKNQRAQVYGTRPITKKSLIDAKQSSDQVVEITVRCAEMESRRLSIILDFFIRHFINVAECYHEYRALPQKITYIEHAERLSVLLAEHSSDRGTARTYLDKLKSLKRRVRRSKSQNDPPATPQRNSDRPIFTEPLNDRFQPPVESQSILRIRVPEESSAYKMDKPTSPYKLNPPPSGRKQVTMPIVHEVDSEGDHLEVPNGKRREEPKKNVILSLAEKQNPSFSSEDTYI